MKSLKSVAGYRWKMLHLSLALLSVFGAIRSRPREGGGIAQVRATTVDICLDAIDHKKQNETRLFHRVCGKKTKKNNAVSQWRIQVI